MTIFSVFTECFCWNCKKKLTGHLEPNLRQISRISYASINCTLNGTTSSIKSIIEGKYSLRDVSYNCVFSVYLFHDCHKSRLYELSTLLWHCNSSPGAGFSHMTLYTWNQRIKKDIEKLNILRVSLCFKHVITHEFLFSPPPGFNFNIIIIWSAFQCQQFINISFVKILWIKIHQSFQFYSNHNKFVLVHQYSVLWENWPYPLLRQTSR